MEDKNKLGSLGEEKAARYMEGNGYKVVEKNFRCRRGEIDLILQKGKIIVFVEVKTRSTVEWGLPCENIDYKKMKKVKMTALYYMSSNNKIDKGYEMRMDTVELLKINEKFYIRHIDNAF